MTKAEWISVIQNTLKQGDETGYVRGPLIERHIQSVYEQMYNELYRQDPHGIEKYLKNYSDTITGENLTGGFTLTNKAVSLPRISGGYFDFSSNTSSFVMTTWLGYQHSVQSNFDTVGMKGQYLATIIGDDFWSQYSPGTPDSLYYWMIPKFTTLSATDEVKIPGGMEDHFIDRVIDTIQHMPPVDLMNDNA